MHSRGTTALPAWRIDSSSFRLDTNKNLPTSSVGGVKVDTDQPLSPASGIRVFTPKFPQVTV